VQETNNHYTTWRCCRVNTTATTKYSYTRHYTDML